MARTSKQYEWQMMTATVKMLLIWADTGTDAAIYAREELARRGYAEVSNG